MRRLPRHILPIVLFAALAVWSTWPLAPRAAVALPLGNERVPVVPLFNLWTIWWNADRLAQGFDGYWNAPIFHPVEGAFAFSEPQPATAIVAPLVWCCGLPTAYAAYLLLALTFNGWCGFLLFRTVGISRRTATCGGAMLAMLPFVHWQLGVLQLVPLWGVLWTLAAVWRVRERPTLARGAVLGLALAVAFLTCAHHALFLSVLLLCGAVWVPGTRLLRWRSWTALLAGVAVTALLAGPIAATQWSVLDRHEFARNEGRMARLSAEWADYTSSPWEQAVPLPSLADEERRRSWPLSPGWTTIALAVAGVAIGLARHRWRVWTGFSATLLVAAVVLSLGPEAALGPVAPYRWLVASYPGFEHARNVYRFALFAQLASVLLAVVALHVLDAAARARLAGWPRRAARLGVLALGLLAAFEIVPDAQRTHRLPDPDPPWVEWLAAHTDEDAVIACVPFAEGRRLDSYVSTTRWMYHGTRHRRRLANGYSGYFPARFLELKQAMANFPDDRSLRLLVEAGVSHLVIRRDHPAGENPLRTPVARGRLTWVFGDGESGVDVYRLRVES